MSEHVRAPWGSSALQAVTALGPFVRCLGLSALTATTTLLMAAGPPPAMAISPGASALFGAPGEPRVRTVIATAGPGFTNAPVPDTDARIPFVKDPSKSQAQLGPGVFAPPATGYRGEGYTPGSSAEAEQQRKVKPGAGVSLKVPLN